MLLRCLTTVLLCAAIPATADTLRRGLGPEPDSLDIHQAQSLAALQVLRDIGEGLLTYDARGELAPGVAASWSVSEDGLEWQFELRDDARWSNGDPVRATDFVRAWQTALAPRSLARTASLLAVVAGARDVIAGYADPSELGVRAETLEILRVRLEYPSPWFLEVLAHPVSFPMHPGAGADILARPANGAFRVAETVPHSHIRLQRNARFHAVDAVSLQRVDYLPIEDPGAELSRYRAGEVDITETIPPGRFDWLQENLPGELRVSPYLGTFWLGINMRRSPLGEHVALRRALALAIDRQTLVDKVIGAGELPAWSVVPPGLSGYQPQADHAQRLDGEARLAEARELYRRSGYGPDRPLRVQLRFNTSTQHRRMAVAVAAMWKQALGVQTELIHEEWKVFVNNRRQGVRTEVFRGGWIADYADPATFLELFRGGDELNTTFYANRQYDALLDQAAARGGAQRMQLLQQAETLLMRDMPIIPLYYYVSRHLVKPRVRGFHDNVRDIHLSRYLAMDPSEE